MKLSVQDIEYLRQAIGVFRIVGCESLVLTNGYIAGLTPDHRGAVWAKTAIELDPKIKLGIGQVNEFDKRLAIFNEPVSAELKVTDGNDVSMITLIGGKTKVQFRATRESLIKYPKGLDDEPHVQVMVDKGEANQIVRALKSLGAESITIAINRSKVVSFEAIDKTNDKFSIEIAAPADFIGAERPVVLTYKADRFATILDALAKEHDGINLQLGEYGSITNKVRGHTVFVMPLITGAEEDDE